MPKKARKPKTDKSYTLVNAATPTKTPQETMHWLDAENMVRLLHELIAAMPSTFRTALTERGFLQFKVKDYDILITVRTQFERPTSEYGKVVW